MLMPEPVSSGRLQRQAPGFPAVQRFGRPGWYADTDENVFCPTPV